MERAEKLKNIQSKITNSQAKKVPVRQAKLAYVAGPPKPSAQVKRKQNRFGTGEDAEAPREKIKQVKMEMLNRHREEASHTVPFMKIPRRERCSVEPTKPRPRQEAPVKRTGSHVIETQQFRILISYLKIL